MDVHPPRPPVASPPSFRAFTLRGGDEGSGVSRDFARKVMKIEAQMLKLAVRRAAQYCTSRERHRVLLEDLVDILLVHTRGIGVNVVENLSHEKKPGLRK